MRRAKSRPAYPWVHRGGGVIYCTEHQTTTYAGVCAECCPPSMKQGECSRGPDADPRAARRYANSSDSDGREAAPLTGQPLAPLMNDPYEMED